MNLLQRFLSWLLSSFKRIKYKEPKKEAKKKRPKYKGYCEYCKTKRGYPDYFYCKYCKNYHCEKHRLPEEHRCPNPRSPYIKWDKNT